MEIVSVGSLIATRSTLHNQMNMIELAIIEKIKFDNDGDPFYSIKYDDGQIEEIYQYAFVIVMDMKTLDELVKI